MIHRIVGCNYATTPAGGLPLREEYKQVTGLKVAEFVLVDLPLFYTQSARHFIAAAAEDISGLHNVRCTNYELYDTARVRL